MAADRILLVCLLMGTEFAVAAADSRFQCHENTPCSGRLPGPGPMNMSANENVSMIDFHGSRGAIWHCVDNFTSFQWYRLINNTLVMFPWGRQNGMQLCDNNQTIIIERLENRDYGTYIYKASNATAVLTGYFIEEVVCKPGQVHLTTEEQPVQYVIPGSQKTLHCTADFGDCSYHDGAVMWFVNTSRGLRHVENSTDRFITCDTGGYNGQSCNLTFSKVSEEDFGVEFVCYIATSQISPGTQRQYSVYLLPFYTISKLLLGIVTGCALACVILCLVTVVCVRRNGESIKFWLRRQPDRGKWEHDLVLIHGDDHVGLVQGCLQPRLREEGYDICTARPGMPEVMEQASAILSAYSVIFSFSPRELHGPDSQTLADLAVHAKRAHSRNYVIVIRREQDADVSMNPWKNTAYSSFKHITWPSTDIDQQSGQSLVDTFWDRLHDHLPTLQPTASSVSSQRETRNSCSSSDSRRHLLEESGYHSLCAVANPGGRREDTRQAASFVYDIV